MLYRELLEQAYHLATKEPKRPKDASLRRAVSAAYYSMFHLLIHEATRFLVAGSRSDLRHRLARCFEHRRMREAAMALSKQCAPELKRFAETFVDLQKERHDADYDLSKRFRRSEVEALLARAKFAIEDWSRVRDQGETEVFLVSLLCKLPQRYPKQQNSEANAR